MIVSFIYPGYVHLVTTAGVVSNHSLCQHQLIYQSTKRGLQMAESRPAPIALFSYGLTSYPTPWQRPVVGFVGSGSSSSPGVFFFSFFTCFGFFRKPSYSAVKHTTRGTCSFLFTVSLGHPKLL